MFFFFLLTKALVDIVSHANLVDLSFSVFETNKKARLDKVCKGLGKAFQLLVCEGVGKVDKGVQ